MIDQQIEAKLTFGSNLLRGFVTMKVITAFLLSSSILVLANGSASAQYLNLEASNEIMRLADSLCETVEQSGESERLQISGAAKAEVEGLFKRLAEIGVEGVVASDAESYVGVVQAELGDQLIDVRNCKMTVFLSLKDALIVQTPTAQKPADDAAPGALEMADALDWYRDTCGTFTLIVPMSPGSTTDMAARDLIGSLLQAGGFGELFVINQPGQIRDDRGNYRVSRVNALMRDRDDGCSVAIVPVEVEDKFFKPFLRVDIDGKIYSIVQPRSVPDDTLERWDLVLYKTINDDDFKTAIRNSVFAIDVAVEPRED